MGHIFNLIFVFPLLNLLVFFYNYIPDIGVVIILITVLVRLLLLPSFHKSLKHQRALTALQPKMHEIREKYKDDKEAQARATMELYKVHKVNPLSSCLPLLIQLPILIGLYQVFMRSLNGKELTGLYHFIHAPAVINPIFLHWINPAHRNIIMAVIPGVFLYFLNKNFLPPTPTTDSNSNKITFYNPFLLHLVP